LQGNVKLILTIPLSVVGTFKFAQQHYIWTGFAAASCVMQLPGEVTPCIITEQQRNAFYE